MINIKELIGKDIGRWVKYTGSAGEETFGRIKTWNDIFIFVVYNCNNEWDRFKDFTPSPTNPKCLKFVNKNLEELKKLLTRLEWINKKGRGIEFDYPVDLDIMDILQELIPLLEDFEKRLIKLEKEEEGFRPRIRLIKEGTIKKGGLNETPATPRPKRRPKGQQTIKSERMDHLETGAQIGKSREKPKTKGGRSGRYIRK